MREIEREVTSGGKVVAKIKIPQATTWAEAIKLCGGDEAKALAKFNAQFATDQTNKARKPSTGGLGKLVTKLMNDPKASQQDKDKLSEILKKYDIKV